MLGGIYGELLDLKHTAKWMNKKANGIQTGKVNHGHSCIGGKQIA